MENTFDWFVGTWSSKQRRLRRALAGNEDWYEFPGTHRVWNALDGIAQFDEALFPTEGLGGITLRLYDKERDEWALYWASSRNGLLALPPTVGRFGEDGVGVFTNQEEFEGKQITVRYLWSDITPSSARWEQAFSLDHGDTWEPNWIAEFTRTG